MLVEMLLQALQLLSLLWEQVKQVPAVSMSILRANTQNNKNLFYEKVKIECVSPSGISDLKSWTGIFIWQEKNLARKHAKA